MNIAAIAATIPLVVLYMVNRRPVAPYARPRFLLELGTLVGCGLAGSFISSDVGPLLVAVGVLPLIVLTASLRRCFRLSQVADAERLRQAVTVSTWLMWPTVATPLMVRLRREIGDQTDSPEEYLEWLTRAADHPRATPIAAIELSRTLGTGRVDEIARSLLAAGTQLDDQLAGATALAFIDLPAVLDWYTSPASLRVRRNQGGALEFACLTAAGRTAAVERLLATGGTSELDRAIARSQTATASGADPDTVAARLHELGSAADGELRRRRTAPIHPQTLSPTHSAIVDDMEARALDSVKAAGKDLGMWRPTATWSICAVIVAVFLAQLTSGPLDGQHLYDMGAFVTGGPTIEWWRALTAPYLHASTAHMAFNVLSLLWLGRLIEAQLPRRVFLFLWFAASSGAFVLFGLVQRDEIALSAGASGGVMGVLGAGIALFAAAMHRNPNPVSRGLLTFTVALAVLQLLLDGVVPRVSQLGHLAGLACGLVVGGLWAAASKPDQPA